MLGGGAGMRDCRAVAAPKTCKVACLCAEKTDLKGHRGTRAFRLGLTIVELL